MMMMKAVKTITSRGIVPAKSLTLTSAPRLMSSLTCLASPRMAAMWRGVSPRSFLLLTLSFCRDEALLGTFFCTGVVCEGWLGVESGHRQREKYLIDAWSKNLSQVETITCNNVQGIGLSNHSGTGFTGNLKDCANMCLCVLVGVH